MNNKNVETNITELTDRLKRVVTMRESDNQSFETIADSLGIKAYYARVLYNKAKRLQERIELGEKGDPYFGLSSKSVCICKHLELENREQIKSAILDGRLHPKQIRGYGWKTHIHVHRWLNLPEPKQKDPLKACPTCGRHWIRKGQA